MPYGSLAAGLGLDSAGSFWIQLETVRPVGAGFLIRIDFMRASCRWPGNVAWAEMPQLTFIRNEIGHVAGLLAGWLAG